MAYGFIAFLTGALSVFLILLILVQRGRGGGLAGALGGAGGNSAFGAKAGDLFTKITVVVAGIWFIACIALTVSSPTGNGQFDDPNQKYQVEKPGIAAAKDGKEGDENSSSTPAAEKPTSDSETSGSDVPTSKAPAAETPAEKKTTDTSATKSDEKPKKETEKSE